MEEEQEPGWDGDEGEIELQSSLVTALANSMRGSGVKNGLSGLSHTGLKGQPPCVHLNRSLNVGKPLGQAAPCGYRLTCRAELKVSADGTPKSWGSEFSLEGAGRSLHLCKRLLFHQ